MADKVKMRVLHIINSLGTGGAEKLLVDSISFYRKEGIQVDILLLDGAKTPFFEKAEKEMGIKIYIISNSSIYNPLLLFKISKFLKNYDILHGHLFPTLYWLAFAKLIKGKKAKIVYTEHSTSNRRRTHFLLKYIDRLIYSQYNRIITISNEVDKKLRTHLGINTSKIVLIKNGINLDDIRGAQPASDTFNFNENSKIIIQVSSFRYPKDQKTVIKALKILPENFKLILVGAGELIDECKELASELQVSDRVKFLGIRMDVPQLLKKADYVVLSSAHEGLSLSSVEGLASGKPFIATNVPGLAEIVVGAGILFEYRNYKELAEVIEKLDRKKEYKEKIVVDCMNRANKYDIRKMVEGYISLYKSII